MRAMLPLKDRVCCFESRQLRVDKYGTVMVSGDKYSVPDNLVGEKVDVHDFSNLIEIYYQRKKVAEHEKTPVNGWKLDLMHYLKTFEAKPGSIAGSAALHYAEPELRRNELPEGMKNILPELETLDFIRQHRNIVLYGNPGTGKTHIATALGIKACMEGMSVMFTSVPHLITQIKECRSSRTLHALENRFKKYDLVICDEFGYVSCDKEAGELLFNHLSLRADGKSTIVTTNLAFERWNEVIKDKILVAALIDRITQKAYLINMNGESYRLKLTKLLNKK